MISDKGLDKTLFNWFEANFPVKKCSSDQFIYDDMDSQTGYYLPFIYQPFDPNNRFHWVERGWFYDYLYSVCSKDALILDLGPGDGWPTLALAPHVKKIIGIDASKKRVDICKKNAVRMNLKNAYFQRVKPNSSLPFPDDYFDGAVCAYSLEQTPDPEFMLAQLYRILKKGGKIRIKYEALDNYQGDGERDFWLSDSDNAEKNNALLILYERNIKENQAIHYRLDFDISAWEVVELSKKLYNFKNSSESICSKNHWYSTDQIKAQLPEHIIYSSDFYSRIKGHIKEIKSLQLIHPDGKKLDEWMRKAGFSQIKASHSGGFFGGKLFDDLGAKKRPKSKEGVIKLLQQSVKTAISLEAPLFHNPPLLGIK